MSTHPNLLRTGVAARRSCHELGVCQMREQPCRSDCRRLADRRLRLAPGVIDRQPRAPWWRRRALRTTRARVLPWVCVLAVVALLALAVWNLFTHAA